MTLATNDTCISRNRIDRHSSSAAILHDILPPRSSPRPCVTIRNLYYYSAAAYALDLSLPLVAYAIHSLRGRRPELDLRRGGGSAVVPAVLTARHHVLSVSLRCH